MAIKKWFKTVIDALTLFFIVAVIIPLWFIAGRVEQAIMRLKGYDYDYLWGGYKHRKTGKRV